MLSGRSGALPLDQREANIDGALADRFPGQALQQQFPCMEGDMDINCGVVIEGEKTVQEMGQVIFDDILKIASGQKSKSELAGAGEDEFVPWPIGVLA